MAAVKDTELNTKKSVFIVSQFVDKEQNSTGYYWYKIIIGLSEHGVDTKVISTKESCESVKKSFSAEKFIPINGLSHYKKNNLMQKGLVQLFLCFQFTYQIFKHVKKGDIILSGTNPSLMLLFTALAKSIRRFEWVLLVHDVFPENLVPANVLKQRSFFYAVLKRVFDRAYCSADTLIAIGRDMQDILFKKTGNREKTKYIPNWVDLDDIVSGDDLSQSYFQPGRPKKIVFQFFGNIGRLQGIDEVLKAISKLNSDQAAFLFIGGGTQESKVRAFIQDHPNLDIVLSQSVPFKKNNEILSSCDIAIVPLTRGMLGLGVPSKAYFSLAADKPILVIGDQNAELDLTIRAHPDIGWSCQSGDVNALVSIFSEIIASDLVSKHNIPRSYVAKHHGVNEAISQIASIIHSIGK